MIEVVYNGWLCDYFADVADTANHHEVTMNLRLTTADEKALFSFNDCVIKTLRHLRDDQRVYKIINPIYDPYNYNSNIDDAIKIENDKSRIYISNYTSNRIKIIGYYTDIAPINHYPPNLQLLIDAYNLFWVSVNHEQKETHPKNNTIKDWLIEKGVDAETARRVVSLLRPVWAGKEKL